MSSVEFPERDPLDADPVVAAWQGVMQLAGWGRDRIPRFPAVAMELGFAPKQMGVIWRLEPGMEMPMRQLGESLFCEASYMTDLVDRLEERGLIERRPSPSDRRVKLVALTPEGELMRKRAMEKLLDPPEELKSLSPEDVDTLVEILGRALAAATPHRAVEEQGAH